MAQQGKINLLLSHNLSNIHGNGTLTAVETINKDKETIAVEADYFIPLYGLTPKLGPIADWG
ncbi:hypothetical protein KUH03_27080 [Sphingobacterium sp. E70]|uniref:hypothetical protein n=1 Tax=Sphingobacterium sp. E70 TaxID=2853439 RepID=UPI00211CF802|nr:hypothetical protein [Sphingobacterium sp. E70]ULT29216.1 hypothetical protein KUH03_27080 [Sphingobacterium sp. E70]